ncbi:ABC transporter permease [bacterium]|nr:ABC transporter permease [bacterium]
MNTLLYDRLAKDRTPTNRGRDSSNHRSATGDNYQSLNLFSRLLWKEYRQLQPIWIALAGIIFVIAGLMALQIVIQHPAITGNLILFIPCLFSLSAGSLFFANEKEQGTDRWLSQWTVPAFTLFISKYLVALSGTLLLAGWAASIVYLFGLPISIPEEQESWTILLAIAGLIGSYIFTATASAILGRVLTSAVIGGVITYWAISFFGLFLTEGELLPNLSPLARSLIEASPVLFPAVLGLCVAITLYFLSRGLSEKSVSLIADRGETPVTPLTHRFHHWRTPRRTVVLLWKEFRQSRLWIFGIVAFTVYVLLGITWFGWTKSRNSFATGVSAAYLTEEWYDVRSVEVLFLFLGSIFMGVAYFSGLLTFMGEQRGRSFRFLTHQGVSARQLWVLKQAFWLPLVFLWIAIPFVSSSTGRVTLIYWWAPWGMLTAFATLQLAMLLIPQTIVALVVGVCGCAILLYYSLAMTLLDVPFWVLAIPMPIFLSLSSFFLSRDWMEERRGWLVAARKFGIIVGPIAFLFVATCLFRVFEIPSTPAKDLLPAQLISATAEELATANAYRELSERAKEIEGLKNIKGFPSREEEQEHRRSRNALLNELIETTKRPMGMFTLLTPDKPHDLEDYRRESDRYLRLQFLLDDKASQLEREGNWKEALSVYLAKLRLRDHAIHRGDLGLREHEGSGAWNAIVRWAKQPSTTVDEIIEVIDLLKNKMVVTPTAPLDWYLADHEYISHEPNLNFPSTMLGAIYFFTPWEQARSRRLEDYIHAFYLKRLKSFAHSPTRTMSDPLSIWALHFITERPSSKWVKSTSSRMSDFYQSSGRVPAEYEEYMARKHLAALAAIAWAKEHGSLPADLKLATKQYLGGVPVVPDARGMPYGIRTWKDHFDIVPEYDSDLAWEQRHAKGEKKPELEPRWSFTLDPNKD